MLASRLLPDQVEQEAAWKAAMPGGLQQLAAQPREAMDYANDQVGVWGSQVQHRWWRQVVLHHPPACMPGALWQAQRAPCTHTTGTTLWKHPYLLAPSTSARRSPLTA